MFKIEWTKRAVKQLSKIQPQNQRRAIGRSVEALQTDPINHVNVKALTNHDQGYRLRVGNYRVLFNIQQSLEIIKIEKVVKRDERTY